MDHIQLDTDADVQALQRKYGDSVGRKVWQYYESQMDSASSDVLDQILMTQFDSMLGPTRTQQGMKPRQQPQVSVPATVAQLAVNTTTTNECNQQPAQRSKERSRARKSTVGKGMNAAGCVERSANAAKVRSNSNTNTPARSESIKATASASVQIRGAKTGVTVAQLIGHGSGSWEHAMQKAEAQIQEECGLQSAPTEAGYLHLYNLETSRRANAIMNSRERRCKRRENRKNQQSEKSKDQ